MRLVHSRRNNRVNTFAYVEFASPASNSPALLLDRCMFMEKCMYVSPFRERGEKPVDPQRVSKVRVISLSTGFHTGGVCVCVCVTVP